MGSRAAELHGVNLRRKPADLDIIGTMDEADVFRRANSDQITSEKRQGPQRFHFFFARDPLYKKVEFGAESFVSNDMLRQLCTTDTASVFNSEVFVPSVNVLALTKRCHLNYPLSWQKHFKDYNILANHATRPTAQERAYYEQCRVEVRERYARKGVKYQLPALQQPETRGQLAREDIFLAIAIEPGAPVCQVRGLATEVGQIQRGTFEAMLLPDRLQFAQELFIVLGIEELLRKKQPLNKFAVYRMGIRRALRDLYLGWFQDFCLDNIPALRAPPKHDYMGAFEAARQDGRVRDQDDILGHSDMHLARGIMLHKAGRVLEAERGYRAVLRQDPDNLAALHNLGMLRHRGGRLADAERLFRRAAALDERNAKLLTSLAAVLLQLNRTDEATVWYKQAIRANPRLIAAHTGLARAHLKAGRPDAAISACRAALRIDPRDKTAGDLLRDLLRSRRELSKARPV